MLRVLFLDKREHILAPGIYKHSLVLWPMKSEGVSTRQHKREQSSGSLAIINFISFWLKHPPKSIGSDFHFQIEWLSCVILQLEWVEYLLSYWTKGTHKVPGHYVFYNIEHCSDFSQIIIGLGFVITISRRWPRFYNLEWFKKKLNVFLRNCASVLGA